MTYLIGQNHSVVRLGPLRIWADNGIICIEDARDNSFVQLSVREALLRIKGLNDMIGNSVDSTFERDQIIELQRFVESMTDVCRKAKEQGMPDDPSAARDLARRRKRNFVMPSKATSMEEL